MKSAFICLFIFLNSFICAGSSPFSLALQKAPNANPAKKAAIATVINALPTIEGWCWEKKAAYLMNLVFEEQPSVCVEIGVFGGSSAFPIMYALKMNQKGVLYAIDPWKTEECVKFHSTVDTQNALNQQNLEANYKWWKELDIDAIYRSFLDVIKRFQLKDFVKVIRKTSVDAASSVPNAIDILHIDGNHSDEASMLDVMTYLPKVKVGGYILFDDAFQFENRRAAQYLIDHCEFMGYVDQNQPGQDCLILRKIN